MVQLFSYDTEQDMWALEEEVVSAWKNASAAKRSVKESVQHMTPRKSVKMITHDSLDEKGKPNSFYGELIFKA